MGEVEVAFIQEPHNRPNPSLKQDDQGIPLIDLSNPDVEALVADIGRACKQWGFLQIINHGVPTDLQLKMEEVQRQFFHQSMDEKRKVKRDAEKVMGFFDAERTKDVMDWKEVFDYFVHERTLTAASVDPGDDRVAHWENQRPQNPPEMREVCQEYAKEMVELAMRLLGLIAMSLGLPPKRSEECFKDHMSSIRLSYYLPCPFPQLALGVGPHKDPGILSILAQDDVRGLEVKRKSDGQWVGVKPTPNAYIINHGDVLQVWANDAYDSVEHRVMVNSAKERCSMVFFLYPSRYTMVEPPVEVTDEQNPAKYRAHNWGKFLRARKGSNYKKLNGETIQIKHSWIN